MVIVSDTSPISNLLLIGKLDVLYNTVGEIIIPQQVAYEIDQLRKFNINLENFNKANWITIKKPTDAGFVDSLRTVLDAGEAQAIALAKELNADYILIDERLGRNLAQKYSLNTIGLLGILIKAKQKGLLPEIKTSVDELIHVAKFWISDKLYHDVLTAVNE